MVRVWYTLYDRMLCKGILQRAFRKVKSEKGAAGSDGQSIEDFARDTDTNLDKLLEELRTKSYRPLPVRRCNIPKPTGGIRELGIPAVRDRVVQQALQEILEPIFDRGFHPSSYGYRPGRSCHQAITEASLLIREEDLQWVVDLDLTRCFDTLDHDLILKSVRKRVRDGSILNLIRMFLQSGVITGDGWCASESGSPQGGVISPLLANIYLDAFDQYMTVSGYKFIRYADDILVFSRSRSGAKNALLKVKSFLEEELNLEVNQKKTRICQGSKGVRFLGVEIKNSHTSIQKEKLKRFKEKVKMLTQRNRGENLKTLIAKLNPLLRGYANYFRIANCKGVFEALMSWIRRRLRARQMKLWKKVGKLHRRLRGLGYKGPFKFIKMNSWRNSGSPLAHMSMTNSWFHEELGLFDMSKVQVGITVSI